MSVQLLENIVIGVAVVALVLYRQRASRQVKTDNGNRLMLVLGGIGLFETANHLRSAGASAVEMSSPIVAP